MKSVAFRRPAEGKDAPPGSQETQSRWGGFPGGSSAMMRNVGLRTQLKKERERDGCFERAFFQVHITSLYTLSEKEEEENEKKTAKNIFYYSSVCDLKELQRWDL